MKSPLTVLIGLAFILAVSASAQISVVLPKKAYKQHEKIDLTITNKGSKVASFCVEFGHWSVTENGTMESTPTPVLVQRRTDRGWNTLLIGPDVGSSRHSVSIMPGETQQYPFRLSAHGEMRAMLYYWTGENRRTCETPTAKKTAKSNEFRVD